MSDECTYNLSSVWEEFEFTSDPYAAPSLGFCEAKQGSKQGLLHSEQLGGLYRDLLSSAGLFGTPSSFCSPSNIRLEMDAAQKNQQTTQHVFKGLCGSFPSPSDFPESSSIDRGEVAPGKPFFLATGVCDSPFLRSALSAARSVFFHDSDFSAPLRAVGDDVAALTSKPRADDADLATLLDNVEDCVVSHECHGLTDSPSGIFPLFPSIDTLETESRLFPFDYYEKISTVTYDRFVQNYFGYYFVVLRNRMQKMIDHDPSDPTALQPPVFDLQVTSDSILSPMLKILRAPKEMTAARPVWLSQIMVQLLKNNNDESYAVRVTYNGEEVRLFSAWSEFEAFVAKITPSVEDCQNFYENYSAEAGGFSKRQVESALDV
jgi:hypothetical protein